MLIQVLDFYLKSAVQRGNPGYTSGALIRPRLLDNPYSIH